jgi:antitoxin (DNA-binding transcriptional repressor) of toxin-antitoxin stability system
VTAGAARMSITQVRNQLRTLLRGGAAAESVEITKRGQTIGLLLVGPRAVSRGQALVGGRPPITRPTLRGTVEIRGDLKRGLRKVRARLWR